MLTKNIVCEYSIHDASMLYRRMCQEPASYMYFSGPYDLQTYCAEHAPMGARLINNDEPEYRVIPDSPSRPFDYTANQLRDAADSIYRNYELAKRALARRALDAVKQQQELTIHAVAKFAEMFLLEFPSVTAQYKKFISLFLNHCKVGNLDLDALIAEAKAINMLSNTSMNDWLSYKRFINRFLSHCKLNNRWPCFECGRKSPEDPLKTITVIKEDGQKSIEGCWYCNLDDLIEEAESLLKL